MIKRAALTNFLNKFFKPYEDPARAREMVVNGLQISGADEVKKVGLGVSVGLEFFQKAHEAGCNFLVVHHGLSFGGVTENGNKLFPHLESRLKYLYQNEISLAGYHFCLDHHPEIGNNAWVIKKLGGQTLGSICDAWGWYPRFPKPRLLDEVVKECEDIYTHRGLVVGASRQTVTTFAVVSGSGAPDYRDPDNYREFLEKEIELEIVGDMKEAHPSFAKEIGLTLAAFGHYNTETIGVKNLGEVIKKEFSSLPVEFIDVPNVL